MYKIAEEEMVLCPYNQSHVVSKLRIQTHIIKCKKNHPEVKLSTCFYNYTHRLKPEDMLSHYETCPQKARIEGARYYERYPSEVPVKSNLGFSNYSQKPQYMNSLFMRLSNANSLSSISSTNEYRKDGSNKPKQMNSPLETVSSSDDSDDDAEDDNLEALPLPKTTSKAFMSIRKSTNFLSKQRMNPLLEPVLSDDEDEKLEPLPLPKTTSKAFTSTKDSASSLSIESSINSRGYGRGQLIRPISPKLERTNDHLLPDLKDEDCAVEKNEKISKFFMKKNMSCSTLSEEFDDCTTLRSEDTKCDEIDFNGFILKDIDKYVKI